MKKLFILTLLASVAFLSGCTNKSKSEEVLISSGYTNVVMTGYSFFGCDEKDAFHDGFTATGPTGKSVEGVVCSGWFKGSTIRFD